MKNVFLTLGLIIGTTITFAKNNKSAEVYKKQICVAVNFSCETNAVGFACGESTGAILQEAFELDNFVCG